MEEHANDDPGRKAYWEHARKALSKDFRSFANGLESQSLAQQRLGRVARVELLANGKTSCHCFKNSVELQSFLDSRTNQGKPAHSPISREIYILEDLGRTNIEILGSRLRIPPEVFALQWDSTDIKVAPVDRNTFRVNRRHNFRVMYPTLHRVRESIGNRDTDCPLGLYVDCVNNVPRVLQPLDEHRRIETSKHLVGFWSAEYPDGSWTALILVDAVMSKLQLEDSLFEDIKAKLDSNDFDPPTLNLLPVSPTSDWSPFPRLVNFKPLSDDDLERDKDISKPDFVSVFDDLVYLYGNVNHTDNENPLSSMLVVSRYVICLMNGWIQTQVQEYWQLYDKLHLVSYSPHTTKSWFHSWDLSWRTETFHRLTFGSFVVSLIGEHIKSIMRIFAVGKPHSLLNEEDSEAWEALADSVSSLQQRFETLISAYVQEASLHESQIANDQARNVGRLTTLATVLVPISISAAIFSMGGDYLAGQSRFWIFWAVSLPIMFVFALLIFTPALQLLDVIWSALVRAVSKLKLAIFGEGGRKSPKPTNKAMRV